jgi:hypothetical protein
MKGPLPPQHKVSLQHKVQRLGPLSHWTIVEPEETWSNIHSFGGFRVAFDVPVPVTGSSLVPSAMKHELPS